MADLTPIFPHSTRIFATLVAGMAIKARSTGSEIDCKEGYAEIPCIFLCAGLTGKTWPAKPPEIRADKMRPLIFSLSGDAPITAMLFGESILFIFNTQRTPYLTAPTIFGQIIPLPFFTK